MLLALLVAVAAAAAVAEANPISDVFGKISKGVASLDPNTACFTREEFYAATVSFGLASFAVGFLLAACCCRCG